MDYEYLNTVEAIIFNVLFQNVPEGTE